MKFISTSIDGGHADILKVYYAVMEKQNSPTQFGN